MKIIVRMPNWLGDLVMALPAVRGLQQNFATGGPRGWGGEPPEIVLALRKPFADLFPKERLCVLDGSETAALRREGADRIVLMTNSFSTALAAYRAGISERIGYSLHGRRLLLTWPLDWKARPHHQRDQYRQLARAGGAAGTPETARLNPKDFPRMAGLEKTEKRRRRIVLAPGARYGAAKRWGGFGELARELVQSGWEVHVVGGKNEAPRTAEGDFQDWTGRTSLTELAGILASADLVVGNDSGIVHLAAAFGRPVVTLFGPTDESRTAADGAVVVRASGVDCAPCHLRVCPIDHRCMKRISVEHVMRAIEKTVSVAGDSETVSEGKKGE